MSEYVDGLVIARAAYAANPSHAPTAEAPAHGTYCLAMALDRGGCKAHRAFSAATGLGGRMDLIEWNAKASTEEVLAAFDRAIEAERSHA